MEQRLLLAKDVPDNLLADLDRRDAALWLHSLPKDTTTLEALPEFLGLPWRMVLSEVNEPELIEAIEEGAAAEDPITRKRGFIHLIDDDPSRIELPQRCLPIYLLSGRPGDTSDAFQSQLRRTTMLDKLRRSGVRQCLIISGNDDPAPPKLKELWSSGFRSFLTFATDVPNAKNVLETWISGLDGLPTVSLLRLPAKQVVATILARYVKTYPEERLVIRVRNREGNFRTLDITGVDDPERPLLDKYSLIEERDLRILEPGQLSEEDFMSFFRDPETSWRPYAAGLPWERNDQLKQQFESTLNRLDAVGSEGNCITYVQAEPGAGGTTFSRIIAWEFAHKGYPVLIAKQLPFIPDALSVSNFLNRVRLKYENLETAAASGEDDSENGRKEDFSKGKRYEVPWIIVFDRMHWEYRDSDLLGFRNAMEKEGRPVCLLFISEPTGSPSFDTSFFKKIGELNHALDQEEARQLGRHLNRFLHVYGKNRSEAMWDNFYSQHTVQYLDGIATFWVALSFWIRGQYDLSESIQEWMYRLFRERTAEGIMRDAILEIAAMSSEGLPMPEGLLPTSQGDWPISHTLEDSQSSLGALGLVRISVASERYWALAHDILGRLLINALFYDFSMREELGFEEAKDAEHLRFLLLRRVSQKRELGERVYKDFGENFATSIFKIDPDHGHASFVPFWREVLHTLDHMPRSLQDNNRIFRHHTAISRRRIAKLNEAMYGVTVNDKDRLLSRAIKDINYALNSIGYTPGSESNLNLYNSLARAYHDLADLKEKIGAASEDVSKLRKQANEATRRAYEENPTNSYAIETYVRDLLSRARTSDESVVEFCIEALGILFPIIASGEWHYRNIQLNKLADQALNTLLSKAPPVINMVEPTNPIDVLTNAWSILAKGMDYQSDATLSDLPEKNRIDAIKTLDHSAGRGNMQILHLSYQLTCRTYPYDFGKQLDYLQQLQSIRTPQMNLEYGILLYQNSRSKEGDRVFKNLRKLWRESEHFVRVPNRLHWLRDRDSKAVKAVRATVGSDLGWRARSMARVREFQNTLVPFRPEEFDQHALRPGFQFSCYVSFGHNGPFLRPTTVTTK